jgi:hypothetical protein
VLSSSCSKAAQLTYSAALVHKPAGLRLVDSGDTLRAYTRYAKAIRIPRRKVPSISAIEEANAGPDGAGAIADCNMNVIYRPTSRDE